MYSSTVLNRFGFTLNEKQIPQIVEKNKNQGVSKNLLEVLFMRPRQVRYQAALRPDFLTIINDFVR